MQKLEKEVRALDKEAIKKIEITKKVKVGLEAGQTARNCNLSAEEIKQIKDLNLLTIKPIIYIYNISESNPESVKENDVVLDIKTEEDILEMSEEEKKELGIVSGVDKLIIKAYQTLDLITFLTTGEDETRAWTIKKGSTAPEAGAAIHTDFKEKFIRAEVINWNDLLMAGSYSLAKEKGLIRTEGKEYIVREGDVIEFKI